MMTDCKVTILTLNSIHIIHNPTNLGYNVYSSSGIWSERDLPSKKFRWSKIYKITACHLLGDKLEN